MRLDLEEKVTRSVLLIRSAYRHVRNLGGRLELAYIGGKDSDVLVELCKMGDVWDKRSVLRPLHRCTTIDPVGTLRHCADVGVEIRHADVSFRQCVVRSGFPNRFYRHCCGALKEFAIEEHVLVGVRRCESSHRMKNYKEPEQCRTYNGRGKAIQYYPLLWWSDEDVRDFVVERNIACHPLYYDGAGNFHVERRLGCVGCPLQSQKIASPLFWRILALFVFGCVLVRSSCFGIRIRILVRCSAMCLSGSCASCSAKTRKISPHVSKIHCFLWTAGNILNNFLEFPCSFD